MKAALRISESFSDSRSLSLPECLKDNTVKTIETAQKTNETRYPVFETFFSFQGEGVHMGRSAWFVRLFGCPVGCPWCDSAGTWHPEHVPKVIQRRTISDLTAEAGAFAPTIAIITGGEPAIHDLRPLTEAIRSLGIPVHLETSGSFPVSAAPDWITLSPKVYKPPLEDLVERADEFKIIVDQPGTVDQWNRKLRLSDRDRPVWLHPEWSVRDQPEIRHEIIEATLRGHPFRAGWQLHKCYDAR